MLAHMELPAQTNPALSLPTEPGGTIRLDASTVPAGDRVAMGYEHLAVFVETALASQAPIPVQGRHSVEGEQLVFTPFFPFERGITYVVRAALNGKTSDYIQQSFRLEAGAFIVEWWKD